MIARKASQVRESIHSDTVLFRGERPLSKGHKGAIVGLLDKAFGGGKNRKVCLSWLFNTVPLHPLSTKNLDEGQWHALNRWIDSYHEPEENQWLPQPNFDIESLRVLNDSLLAYIRCHRGMQIEILYDNLDSPLTAMMVGKGGQIKGIE